ncbi:MAG TPA: hypothetical protein EYN66_23115, partial [Myxococcales bacterium]|nr:hypothetical protein [Myxococcales bacterium]
MEHAVKRLEHALESVVDLTELSALLRSRFVQVHESPVENSCLWFDASLFAFVEVQVQDDQLQGPASLICGADAHLYLADWLGRLDTHDNAIQLLQTLFDARLHVLELSKGGRRIMLPNHLVVLELRGRRGVLDTARVMDAAASASALDAVLRNLSDAASLSTLLGEEIVRLPGTTAKRWLALGGHALIDALEQGGFTVTFGAGLDQALTTWIATAKDIPEADRWIADCFDQYQRKEQLDRRGTPSVWWRVTSASLELKV